MLLNVAKCPECGSTSFAVEVKTWVNVDAAEDHGDDYPRFGWAEFDPDDADYAEPIEGGDIICRECQHMFANSPAKEGQHT